MRDDGRGVLQFPTKPCRNVCVCVCGRGGGGFCSARGGRGGFCSARGLLRRGPCRDPVPVHPWNTCARRRSTVQCKQVWIALATPHGRPGRHQQPSRMTPTRKPFDTPPLPPGGACSGRLRLGPRPSAANPGPPRPSGHRCRFSRPTAPPGPGPWTGNGGTNAFLGPRGSVPRACWVSGGGPTVDQPHVRELERGHPGTSPQRYIIIIVVGPGLYKSITVVVRNGGTEQQKHTDHRHRNGSPDSTSHQLQATGWNAALTIGSWRTSWSTTWRSP